MAKLNAKVAKEIRKCQSDFSYFCSRYLKIVDKGGNVIPLSPNRAQLSYLKALERNPWLYVLKARQLGLTTIIAAHNFWKALFTPNHRILVMAHTLVAAEVIFKIYRRFYDQLPKAFQFPLAAANVRELSFSHGGLVKVASASSGSARGATYNSIHCSEFAFYKDIEGTVASAFQTAGTDAQIILETTANGINDAHKLWFSDSGYDKLFIGWTAGGDYVQKKRPKKVPPQLLDYQKKHDLTDHQYWWGVKAFETRGASIWNTFRQEYPITAEQAFVTSGARFFTQVYPHAKSFPGYKEYAPPTKYRIYSIGVDTASGSAVGDYSACCVLDVTDKKEPTIAATFYEQISPSSFAAKVLEITRRYNALAVVEANSYGLSIIEYLIQAEWAFLYRRTKYDKIANRWTEQLGFNTSASTRSILLSRLHEYVTNGWLLPTDERFKCEINTFVFSDSGKAEASSGKHDDMIFAVALALMGLDQIEQVQEEILRKRPANVGELLQFELSTGKLYKDSTDDFDRLPESEDKMPSQLL